MLENQLQKHFSFSHFRPGQQEIIQSILDGKDTLAIMPTGGGKSLCFQFPAVILPGLTVVVSPLIALMKNQVDSLTVRNIPAACLNSSLSIRRQHQLLDQLTHGTYKLLYVAPERLANKKFLLHLAKLPISLVAIDEAHCISSWGHDFRPEYQQIANYIQQLPRRPVVAAFTATATQLVQQDIVQRLQQFQPQTFVRGFDRPNLKLFVRQDIPLKQRKHEALRLSSAIGGSGIIYTLTIKEAEKTAHFLQQQGVNAAVYHAKLEPEQRTKIQDDFMQNRVKVVVATIAFGMGIDKADIRFVIHIGMPSNLERYYQEAGRAGRDGETAYCVILHNGRDQATHAYFIQQSKANMHQQNKSMDEIRTVINHKYDQLEAINYYVETTGCRRKIILDYFQDPAGQQLRSCQGCDNCLHFAWDKTPMMTKMKRKLLGKRGKSVELSASVLETARLYKQGFSPEEIQKIRSFALSTIMEHLITWYASGGKLQLDQFLTPTIEQKIIQAMKIHGMKKLKPIKKAVSPNITYEQIKLVKAKHQRRK